MTRKFSKTIVIICVSIMFAFMIYNCAMYAILQQVMDWNVISVFVVGFLGELITLAWNNKNKIKNESVGSV